MTELLRVEDLKLLFPVRGGVFNRTVAHVHAVDGVSFSLQAGETLGLVGESGCGKTTLGRATLRLLEPTGGRIIFDGTDILKLRSREMRAMRRRMQMVFQDPYAALNPRKTIVDLVGEGLVAHHMVKSQKEKKEKVIGLLNLVGLSEGTLYRYPHEFSGGQRQRINIARAISLHPDFLVCDEAVSALDVSIQAQILNLLIELRSQLNMAYLFIGHDLAVVKSIADRIAVMYLGQIMESAPTAALFSSARHPYTQALFSAIPIPDPQTKRQRIILPGDVPTPVNPPSGCRFHPRCPQAREICKQEEPPWHEKDGHGWKCHFGA